MNRFVYLLPIVLLACACQESRISRQSGYALAKDWPRLTPGVHLGQPTGLAIDSDQHLLVFHRAGRTWPLLKTMPGSAIAANTLMVLDRRTGELLHSWGAGLFVMPHGLSVDGANNLWLTDVGLNQVFKFSPAGRLLMTLGVPGVSGSDSLHFNRPTDLAVAHDGSFYVSDGYRNSRIVKFSVSGNYLLEWGSRGHKNGEFHVPHGLALDDKGDVYVADRENRRIQVFDPSGRFIQTIRNRAFSRICAIAFDKVHRRLILVDDRTWLKVFHRGSDIFVLDSTGHILERVRQPRGRACWYHDVTVDEEGNIYVGDILGRRIQKFVPLLRNFPL